MKQSFTKPEPQEAQEKTAEVVLPKVRVDYVDGQLIVVDGKPYGHDGRALKATL